MLPTFTVDGATLLRRITIFLYDGVVDGVIYPVFPPDRSAEVALAWLRDRSAEPTPATSRIAPGAVYRTRFRRAWCAEGNWCAL